MGKVLAVYEFGAKREAKYEQAFKLVADKKDWRAPIHAFVSQEKLTEAGLTPSDVQEAVEFYTATECWFEGIAHKGLHIGYAFEAVGYRNGPAGP